MPALQGPHELLKALCCRGPWRRPENPTKHRLTTPAWLKSSHFLAYGPMSAKEREAQPGRRPRRLPRPLRLLPRRHVLVDRDVARVPRTARPRPRRGPVRAPPRSPAGCAAGRTPRSCGCTSGPPRRTESRPLCEAPGRGGELRGEVDLRLLVAARLQLGPHTHASAGEASEGPGSLLATSLRKLSVVIAAGLWLRSQELGRQTSPYPSSRISDLRPT